MSAVFAALSFIDVFIEEVATQRLLQGQVFAVRGRTARRRAADAHGACNGGVPVQDRERRVVGPAVKERQVAKAPEVGAARAINPPFGRLGLAKRTKINRLLSTGARSASVRFASVSSVALCEFPKKTTGSVAAAAICASSSAVSSCRPVVIDWSKGKSSNPVMGQNSAGVVSGIRVQLPIEQFVVGPMKFCATTRR